MAKAPNYSAGVKRVAFKLEVLEIYFIRPKFKKYQGTSGTATEREKKWVWRFEVAGRRKSQRSEIAKWRLCNSTIEWWWSPLILKLLSYSWPYWKCKVLWSFHFVLICFIPLLKKSICLILFMQFKKSKETITKTIEVSCNYTGKKK